MVNAIQDLSAVYEQLIGRAEGCQRQIQTFMLQQYNNNNNASSSGSNLHRLFATSSSSSSSSKYSLPLPEPVMIQAALDKEAEAGLVELLGNLTRYHTIIDDDK